MSNYDAWPYSTAYQAYPAAPAPQPQHALRTEQAPAKPRKPRRWPWIVGIVAAFIFGNLSGHAGSSSTMPSSAPPTTNTADAAPAYSLPTYEAPAPAPVAPSGPLTSMSDGTYEVGVDVEPGQYKTSGPDSSSWSGSCYWSRNKNDSGQFDAIIANDNISGPGSITIKSGEFIELSGSCVWAKVK